MTPLSPERGVLRRVNGGSRYRLKDSGDHQMAVKGLFAIALVLAVLIGVTLPAKKTGPRTAQVSQITTLALR